jgi:hypothetical protein
MKIVKGGLWSHWGRQNTAKSINDDDFAPVHW